MPQNENIKKRLERLGAIARQFEKDVNATIQLIDAEEGVSTSSDGQKPLSDRELAEVSRRRRERMRK